MPELEELNAWPTDFIISNGFAPIIREPFISAYRSRIINIHPAYLPGGRGIYPNFWCFLDGTPTGVTIHLIDAEIDTGDVIARKKIEFDDLATLGTSYGELFKEAERLFMEVWDDFVFGKVAPQRQEDAEFGNRYHSRIDSEKLIDLLPAAWDTSITTVRNMGRQIRSSQAFWRDVGALIKELKK